MNQLAYRDYYRFLASFGIGVIGLAILLPWAVFRVGFDATLTEERISQLPENARNAVEAQQALASTLIGTVPYLSLLLILAGGIIGIWGVRQWGQKQREIDERDQIETTKLRRELEAMTDEEVEDKHRSAWEFLAPNMTEVANAPGGSGIQVIKEVEETVASAFERCLGHDYKVLRNRRMGVARYDLVVQPVKRAGRDLVVEVKHTTGLIRHVWLREMARTVATAAQAYGGLLMGPASGLLIVATDPDACMEHPPGELAGRVRDELGLSERDFRIVFANRADLEALECSEVRSWTKGIVA